MEAHIVKREDDLDKTSEEDRLIQVFYEHLPMLEGNYPYMYLDSNGYLTIGLGILISKLDCGVITALVQELQRLSYQQLKTDCFEQFETDQINRLYKESSIKSALQKVFKLKFEIGYGRKKGTEKHYSVDIYRRNKLSPDERETKVRAAFDELLRKSILLKAQQKKLGEKYEPNAARSFFSYEGKKGSNHLVIEEKEIESMAKSMIKEKIQQLRHYLPKNVNDPGFDGYPFNVRIALLDMSYNMGAKKLLDSPAIKGGFEQFTKLVNLQQWEEIVKTKHYFRKQVSDERNKFVENCFIKAMK